MDDYNSNDEIKDDSIINDDANSEVANNDTNNIEQNPNDNNKIGNGYKGLASNNREAFTRGLKDNYADRITRNKANLAQARARSNEVQKKGEDGKLEDKNSLDRAKDKVNVLKNKTELRASQIDNVRSKAFQMMHPMETIKIIAKEWLIGFLLSSLPMFLCIFVVFLGVFFVLGLFDGGGSSGGSSSSGIVYESECNYEETRVTVMDGNNIEVLATVSLEDYVLGVMCPEIGACNGMVSSMKEHYIKTKIIASKTYVLARSNYKSSNKSITIKASTRDQQWCDLDTGCIVTKTDDLVPGYSNSYYYNTYPGDYDISEVDGNVTNEYSYTEEDLQILHKYYNDIYGELYLYNTYNSKITTLSSSDATEYKSDTQIFWKDQAKNGKTYEQILEATGNSNVSDAEDYVNKSIYRLENYCEVTRVSNNGTFVELEEYPDVGSTTKINKPITEILSSEEIENLNNYIISSVDEAGYGTGEAVAAAGQSLIYGLYQYGYHLPYWYGGGHGKGITIGVDTNWGKTGKTFDYNWYDWNIQRNRNTYSYDCSGFVSWAVKNACKSNFSPLVGGAFLDFGSIIAFNDAKPGDMMILPGKHIMLVVKNNGNDGLIVAESTPNKITFTSFKSPGNYVIVDMSNWYAEKCNPSR